VSFTALPAPHAFSADWMRAVSRPELSSGEDFVATSVVQMGGSTGSAGKLESTGHTAATVLPELLLLLLDVPLPVPPELVEPELVPFELLPLPGDAPLLPVPLDPLRAVPVLVELLPLVSLPFDPLVASAVVVRLADEELPSAEGSPLMSFVLPQPTIATKAATLPRARARDTSGYFIDDSSVWSTELSVTA